MTLEEMPVLKIGDLEAKLPIIQGGMSVGVSLSGLSSAVANEGGIGVIGAALIGMLEDDFKKNFSKANKRALSKEIRKAKKMTNGIIGVNIMVALTDFDELVKITIDEGADLLFIGAGLPLKNVKWLCSESMKSTKIVPIVSSARATKIIFEYWEKMYERVPDAIVVEGPLAGGHLGFKIKNIYNVQYSLENILPDIISITQIFEKKFNKNIPIIAAGGVYSGGDIYKLFKQGIQGVQMGTRFVATHECDVSIEFKESYVNCKKEDIEIINSPVGLPGRVIKNAFLDNSFNGIDRSFSCPWQCLKTCDHKNAPYCIAKALTNAKLGNIDKGFCFAGENAYKVDKIVSVKELIETIQNEYRVAFNVDNKSLNTNKYLDVLDF